MLANADPDVFDTAVGMWLARGVCAAVETAMHALAGGIDGPALMQVRLDGKTIKGAVDADGDQMHRLAVLAGRPGSTTVVAA